MTPEELRGQLETMTKGLEGKTSIEIKSAIDAFTASNKEVIETAVKGVKESLELEIKAIQDHADSLDIKLQAKDAEKAKQGDTLRKAITTNFDGIAKVKKGVTFDTKVVGNMTLGANLTGDQPRDYNFDVAMIPNQKVNVADLVGSVSISNGTYTYVRETGSEGAIGTPAEGATKGQIDYDVSMIDVNTDFLAGFTRYSKKMRNNLPFLESFVPLALRRDYWKQENANFNTVLAGAATASTELAAGQNKAEMLMSEVATLDALDYETNAIVVTASDYFSILKIEKSTGSGYGLPFGFTYNDGIMRCLGIPVVKANWLAANKYFVGDWSRVNKVSTEGLSLEFSDVEGTNFVANNITARIEAQVALAVEQPAALIYGDFTAA